ESGLRSPVRRKHSPPTCDERRAWSRAHGWPGCGRRGANLPHERGRAIGREVGCTAERDSVAGDGVAALSLTFGQFYQILACCKSQFVSALRPLRPAQHQAVYPPAHLSGVGPVDPFELDRGAPRVANFTTGFTNSLPVHVAITEVGPLILTFLAFEVFQVDLDDRFHKFRFHRGVVLCPIRPLVSPASRSRMHRV